MIRIALFSLASITVGCTPGLIEDARQSGRAPEEPPIQQPPGDQPPGDQPPGDGPPPVDGPPEPASPLTQANGLGVMGLSRLSRHELRQTHIDLFGIDPGTDLELLPQDGSSPFDNDSATQEASAALVDGVRAVAQRAAERVLSDPAARDRVVGCTPSGPDDAICFRSFVEGFGRRALRRDLLPSEVEELMALQTHSISTGDFYVGIDLAIRALVQDPEHLYRFELGEAVAEGLVRLTPFELASRLSYFLWGSMPDDALLDAASSGTLTSSAGLSNVVRRMLADPKAADRVARFHALWLGYENLPHGPSVAKSMREETDALIRRYVMQEKRSWLELFTATESYIDDTMAEIYGLETTGQTAWRDVTSANRRGILSHSAFLSAGGKFGDTSPVVRGIFVRERLLCQVIPPAPPNVDADNPPMAEDENACKFERYAAHRDNPQCAFCHSLIDPIGFGLERYDRLGRYREHDEDRPDCVIAGEGQLTDLEKTFRGPSELAEALVGAGGLEHCMIEHLFQFAVGRKPSRSDGAAIDALATNFKSNQRRVDLLLQELVSSQAFRHRVVEQGDGQ